MIIVRFEIEIPIAQAWEETAVATHWHVLRAAVAKRCGLNPGRLNFQIHRGRDEGTVHLDCPTNGEQVIGRFRWRPARMDLGMD